MVVKLHVIELYGPRRWGVIIFMLRSVYHRGKGSHYMRPELVWTLEPRQRIEACLPVLSQFCTNWAAMAVYVCIVWCYYTVYFHTVLQIRFNLKDTKPDPRVCDNVAFFIPVLCVCVCVCVCVYIYIYMCVCVYVCVCICVCVCIQGVPGGMWNTSGECSLC